jgi:RimJ/RimL family protein N-acetyltransferase
MEIVLRSVEDGDLDMLFAQQLDPEANRMAAFTSPNPSDRHAFDARWRRIRGDVDSVVRAIVADGEVAGSILRWRDPHLPGPEVSYWLGREHWGKGIATGALEQFLPLVPERPVFGRCAADNIASRRVLEKCGFVLEREERGFANPAEARSMSCSSGLHERYILGNSRYFQK